MEEYCENNATSEVCKLFFQTIENQIDILDKVFNYNRDDKSLFLKQNLELRTEIFLDTYVKSYFQVLCMSYKITNNNFLTLFNIFKLLMKSFVINYKCYDLNQFRIFCNYYFYIHRNISVDNLIKVEILSDICCLAYKNIYHIK